MKAVLLPISAALALYAGAAVVPLAPAEQAQAQRVRGPDWATRNYVTKAGAADLYEIRSSELALRRARRPQVRELAEMLIRDHRRTTAEVTDAARRDGVPVRPPMLEPAQRSMIRQLERAGPGAFDRTYLGQQVVAHQQALSLHRNYARTGRARALRRVAASAVPIIQGHRAHVRRLQRLR
jgi:putative membrane protein